MSLSDPVFFDGPFLDTPLQQYPQVLAALLRSLGPHAEVAYALLDRPPGTAESPDVPDPSVVWPTIESAFVPTWTHWKNEGVRRRWHRVVLPEHTEAVATLAELTVSGVGSSFVHTLALAREGEWILVAVPHHSTTRVVETSAVRRGVAEALDDVGVTGARR